MKERHTRLRSCGESQEHLSKTMMKTVLISTFLVMMIGLTGCKQAATATRLAATEALPVTDTPKAAEEATRPVIKTSMGDFLIVTARFVDEVNGAKPNSGEKILLVFLSRPDNKPMEPSTFPLEDFDKMIHDTSKGEISMRGEDGSRTISTMGGWVDKEFAMGFRVPVTAKTYQLFWPGNPAIDIVPEDSTSSS
jgi:hypothetical protein